MPFRTRTRPHWFILFRVLSILLCLSIVAAWVQSPGPRAAAQAGPVCKVMAWGDNSAGQLGDGRVLERLSPAPLVMLNDITFLAAGQRHVLGINSAGDVQAWGFNERSQLTGDWSTLNQASPQTVQGLANVVEVAAGGSFSLALKADGTVWKWGVMLSTIPSLVQVPGLTGIAHIYAGYIQAMALKADGTVWVWGGDAGEAPVQVSGLAEVAKVAPGYNHSLALKRDGTVWAWGSNEYGEAGGWGRVSYSTPVQVPALSGVIDIAAGYHYSMALTQDGHVWTWGSNFSGQLGDNTHYWRYTPVSISGLEGTTRIAAGYEHGLALKNDGTLWAWGFNLFGQLGDGTRVKRSSPAPVSGIQDVTWMAGGGEYTLARTGNGQWWGWGSNRTGELADGSTAMSYLPGNTLNLTNVSAIVNLYASGVALKQDGSVWTWGDNTSGQLGDSTNISRATPMAVPDLADIKIKAIAAGNEHVLALKPDGTLLAWGRNANFGSLGDGTNNNQNRPVPVLNATGVKAIAAGYCHSLAVKVDGSLLQWGCTNGDQTAPAFSGAVMAAVGDMFSLVLKDDGTVWGWGENQSGQLGNGSTAYLSGLVQVSGLTGVVSIAAGELHGLAVKQDGTVWAWGSNEYGQLGDGSFANQLGPVQIPGLSGAVSVSARGRESFARQADGTVWAWGSNEYGQLGDGTAILRAQPVKMLSGTCENGISAGWTSGLALVKVNQSPLAPDQFVSTRMGQAVSIALSGSDPDGDPLAYWVASAPGHGALSGAAPALIYQPEPGYFGPDSFTYKVNDGQVDSSPAYVHIQVNPWTVFLPLVGGQRKP